MMALMLAGLISAILFALIIVVVKALMWIEDKLGFGPALLAGGILFSIGLTIALAPAIQDILSKSP